MGEKTKKQIFVLFSCDEWKDYSSMRLCGASTSATKLKSMVISEIKEKNMIYGDESSPKSAQIKAIRKAFKEKSPSEINDQLIYGYIETVNDGEIY